ncbi:hypothetical protein SCHPADRAFT_890632 [Schizopora paradoxa]|uniref:Transmembrane protein n=1 Tax=Schizopora paradoxa TaxID=27342 RepID=A0A0H2RLB8_9AGAM|nr:hypothetical protein SCHPADRAFT_890632 [Schizopora paradoxa]
MSETLENKYSKVDFDEYDAPSPKDVNLFAPRSSKFGPRFQMIMLLLAGVALMVIHHCFFTYLNRRPVDSLLFNMRGVNLPEQSIVSILGNTIAYAARAVLSTATGIAFIQLLWSKLRRRRYAVADIDALVACKDAPFALKAFPAWHCAFLLAITASTASLMSFISILAPGTLRIESSETSSDCTVPTVSLATSSIALLSISPNESLVFDGSQSQIVKMAGRVLMTGGPLPPLNPCPDSCSYTIIFNAPIANCTPLELATDLSVTLPPTNQSSGRLPVWNVSMASTSPPDGMPLDFKFVAALRNLENDSTSAVSCDTYNGTYTVSVSHSSTTPSTARVVQTALIGLINASETTNAQYNAISTAFINSLLGSVEVDTQFDNSVYFNDNLLVGYSPAFAGTSKESWSPTGDLAADISSFMQNISVSLLSGSLLAMGDTVATSVNTTCWYPASIYDYDQIQLFGIYGAALGVTTICVFFGFWAIRQNGAEESFSFSRLVGAILNKSLFEDRYQLYKGSQLTVNGSEDGQLRLIHISYS